MSLGEFSGVDASLFALAFEELKPPTSLHGSTLSIQEVGLEGGCQDCGHKFPIERFRFVCPACGGVQIEVLRGEELMLESLVLEGVGS